MVGVGLGVLIEVPALIMAILSGGAGHGDYVAARAVFPTSMLLTLVEGGIGTFSLATALLQFPIYGALLGRSIARRAYLPAVLLTLTHLVAASVCFTGTLTDFS